MDVKYAVQDGLNDNTIQESRPFTATMARQQTTRRSPIPAPICSLRFSAASTTCRFHAVQQNHPLPGMQERRRKHPTAWWLRPLASVEATLLKTFSEAGRMAGLLSAGHPRLLGSRFDWFGGMVPNVVRQEVARSVLRSVCHATAAGRVLGWCAWAPGWCALVWGVAGLLLLVV
jgi:hypothetical protein